MGESYCHIHLQKHQDCKGFMENKQTLISKASQTVATVMRCCKVPFMLLARKHAPSYKAKNHHRAETLYFHRFSLFILSPENKYKNIFGVSDNVTKTCFSQVLLVRKMHFSCFSHSLEL